MSLSPAPVRIRPEALRVALLLALILPSSARARALSESLERALADVGRDVVTTGFLLDRTLPLARMERFDGTEAAPAAAAGALRQIVDELGRSRVDGALRLPTADDLRERGRAASEAGVVPIAVVDVAVQRIRPDAGSDGTARVVAGRVEVDAAALETRPVFVAAALAGESRRAADVRFVIPRELWTSSRGALPERLQVDCGDGRGFADVRRNGQNINECWSRADEQQRQGESGEPCP